jgi:hypothetical protein
MFGRACVVDEANRHVAVVVDKEVVNLDGRRVDMLHFNTPTSNFHTNLILLSENT